MIRFENRAGVRQKSVKIGIRISSFGFRGRVAVPVRSVRVIMGDVEGRGRVWCYYVSLLWS